MAKIEARQLTIRDVREAGPPFMRIMGSVMEAQQRKASQEEIGWRMLAAIMEEMETLTPWLADACNMTQEEFEALTAPEIADAVTAVMNRPELPELIQKIGVMAPEGGRYGIIQRLRENRH